MTRSRSVNITQTTKIQTRRPLGGAIPRENAFGTITPTPNLPQSKTCTHLFTGVCCIFWHRPRPFASIKNYYSHISWPIDTKLCTRHQQTHTKINHGTLFWSDHRWRNGSISNICLLATFDVENQKTPKIKELDIGSSSNFTNMLVLTLMSFDKKFGKYRH
jgi:hypothetical protein